MNRFIPHPIKQFSLFERRNFDGGGFDAGPRGDRLIVVAGAFGQEAVEDLKGRFNGHRGGRQLRGPLPYGNPFPIDRQDKELFIRAMVDG